MKARNGFVSNSSSTSFIITNKHSRPLDLSEFVLENPRLIQQYVEQYNADPIEYNQDTLLVSARTRNMQLQPGDNFVTFGDEQGDLVGRVFDYILRGGGKSRTFSWCFYEYNR